MLLKQLLVSIILVKSHTIDWVLKMIETSHSTHLKECMQRISPHLSLFMLIDKKKISLTLRSTTINRLRERIIIGALYIGNNARMMMMPLMRIIMLLMRMMRMIVMTLLPLFVLALRIIYLVCQLIHLHIYVFDFLMK